MKIKRAVLIIMSGLLIVMIAATSCTKNSAQIIAPTITTFAPLFDTANGTVTIIGTAFTGAVAVSFGGTPAVSFKVISDTVITAIVGMGTSGKISVTTPGGIATHNGFTTPQIFCDCTSSNAIDSSNLIAHWTFDSTTAESISKLTPSNSGGSFQYVAGRIGKAISFTNGWLTYPAGATFAGVANSILNGNDTLENGFTISLWAHLPTNVPNDTLFTNLFQLSDPNIANWPLAGIAVIERPDSLMGLGGGLTNLDSTGTHQSADSAYFGYLQADTLSWAFIALVYDTAGHQLQYYFNGVYRGSTVLITGNTSGSVLPTSESFLLPTPNYATIGAFESSNTFSSQYSLPSFMNPGLTGALDDIRFFNIPLNQYNISDLYQLGLEGR
jgi:hypothetical protein